jgi:two-component system, NarL family, nitrate/nitrite response regulator NarL
MPSLLVVDDTCLSREGLAEQLRRKNWADEVFTADDARSALERIQERTPDVVLLSLTCTDGLEILALLRGAAPAVRIIALAVSDDDDDEILACAEAGVAGFVPRRGTIEDLALTVVGVVRGEPICPPTVTDTLLRLVSGLAARRSGLVDGTHITPREREVLVLIEQGMTNKQIAQRLGISVRTVKNHVHNLLEKLRVNRRGEAAARLRSARVPSAQQLLRQGA